MTMNRSRRLFLGGSAAATAVGASGIITTLGAQAATAQALKNQPPLRYGPKPGVAKLNANENPFGPSPAALKAISDAAVQGGAYYAYPAAMRLIDMIAERHGIEKTNISLSAGSSPILSYTALAASQKGNI